MKGRIIESTGSWYKVEAEGSLYRCRVRGRLRLKEIRSTNPVVVGDVVEFEIASDGECIITEVSPRANYIIRRASNLSRESQIIAANIDCAMIVVSLSAPTTPTEFLDRYLVTCEAYKIPAVVVLNKVDIARSQPATLKSFLDSYALAGYRVVETCAKTGEGLDEIKELLKGRTTLLSGNSGVGKSTIVKAVEPSAKVKIAAVSEAHLSGRHTTTYSHIYPLSFGGYIIDTPGIKGFGLIDIAPEEVWHYFPEMMHYGPDCQFYNCTHTHEPNCAVMSAVADGKIAMSRYESYLKILDNDDKYR